MQYFIDKVNAATDVVGRRWALTTLGGTGHPNAVPTLIAAFHDPNIGSAMALEPWNATASWSSSRGRDVGHIGRSFR